MTAFLIVNTQVYPLKKDQTSLGRHLDNDIVIQEATISRSHAEIHISEGKFILKDLGSTGGTFVNGTKVSEMVLHSGDSIMLSSVPMVFVQNAASFTRRAEQKTGQLDAPGHDEEKTVHSDEIQWRANPDQKKE